MFIDGDDDDEDDEEDDDEDDEEDVDDAELESREGDDEMEADGDADRLQINWFGLLFIRFISFGFIENTWLLLLLFEVVAVAVVGFIDVYWEKTLVW